MFERLYLGNGEFITVNSKYLSVKNSPEEFIMSGDFIISANGDLNSYLSQSNCSDTDLSYWKGYEEELHNKPLRD